MRAIEIRQFGAPEVLSETTRPDPIAGAGEVLIRVAASGINRPDVLQRKGLYPMPPGVTDLPGLEVAGTVAGGDTSALAAAGLALGDRVCALVAGGGYAELCVAPIAQTLPVPRGLNNIEAASLPETFFTVWQNVFHIAALQAGEWLLVQGGTKSALDVGALLRKRLSIVGSTLRPRSVAYKGVLARALRERAWPLIEAGRIKPVIHQVFPANDAAAAHALMESGTHIGKIVLDWS